MLFSILAANMCSYLLIKSELQRILDYVLLAVSTYV